MAATITPGLAEQMLAALHEAEGPWGPSAEGVAVTLRLDSAEDVHPVARSLEAWGAVVLRVKPTEPAVQALVPPGRLWDLLGLEGVVEVAEGALAGPEASRGRWAAAAGAVVLVAGLVVWWMAFSSGPLPASGGTVGREVSRTSATQADGNLPAEGVVAAVLAGDRIRLASGHIVRLAGLRAPAYHHPERGDEPYGREARRALSALVEGRTVSLTYSSRPKAPDGALRTFISLGDGTDVGAALLRQGAVEADLDTAGALKRATFGRLEADARENRRGLWGGPIVGNRGSKVYHLPGGRFYRRVSPTNQVLFATEAEARAAGYRRSVY